MNGYILQENHDGERNRTVLTRLYKRTDNEAESIISSLLLVTHRQHGTKLYTFWMNYQDGSRLDAISRKMLSSGFKKAVSTGARSAIAHKVADTVVNGAKSATQKAVEGAVNKAINKVKVLGKKRCCKKKKYHMLKSQS